MEEGKKGRNIMYFSGLIQHTKCTCFPGGRGDGRT